jgi:ABC-type glutathione transport system ATPase component
MVTHDPSIARVSDRILRMQDGVCQTDVIPSELLGHGTGDYGELLKSRISELDANLASLDSQFRQGIITGDEYVNKQTSMKRTIDILREELHRLGIVT